MVGFRLLHLNTKRGFRNFEHGLLCKAWLRSWLPLQTQEACCVDERKCGYVIKAGGGPNQ